MKRSKVISFRVPVEVFEELRAKTEAGVSVGELVRRWLLSAVDGPARRVGATIDESTKDGHEEA